MRIKWNCPPTNKELINIYISNYLENSQVVSGTELKYSDIITNVNNIISRYEKIRSCTYNEKELNDHDIRRLYILKRNLYIRMRIRYIESAIEEIVV